MKHLLIVIITVFTFSTSFSQNKEQLNILDNFIIAHNDGTEDAIRQFIKEAYLPEIYENININEHVTYYKELINEFGDLSKQIYYLVEETPHKLIVHLIKKNQNIKNLIIDPENILQVQIDLSEANSKYMIKGLGLGSIIPEYKQG
jgi:hypothetical protein